MNTEYDKCIQKGVIFLSYEDTLGMAIALIAFCFSAFTAVVRWVFVKHHNTPNVRANNRILSYLLLMSLMFCFLCSFFCIGYPNRVTCILQQIISGIVFTVAVSAVLAKTITVVLAFKVTDTLKKIETHPCIWDIQLHYSHMFPIPMYSVCNMASSFSLPLLILMNILSMATSSLFATRAQLLHSTVS